MEKSGPIVVGTDGSARAELALDRAGQLAKLLGVKLHIVTCFEKAASGVQTAAATRGAPMESVHGTSAEGRTRADHSVSRAQQRLANLGVENETHVWPGEPADALVEIAKEQGAQMIVVGNRGMAGARRVLGSVPNSVSHRAPCDVLIVTTG